MKHSTLSTILSLAYPPISNYDFSFVKEELEVQEYLKKSQLYMLSQRPRLVFDNVFMDDEEKIHFEIRQETTKNKISGVFPIRQSSIYSKPDETVYVEFGSYNKNYIFKTPPHNDIDGFKFYNEKEEFETWLTPERLIYEYSHGILKVEGMKGWDKLITYKILYVGKATDQEIWKRLTGHEKLQDIISKEFSLQYGTLPTHEVTLLLFKIDRVENFEIKAIINNSNIDLKDVEKALKFKKLPNDKVVFLDAEKVFIKLLNPNYNKIKFKLYPKSSDGLFNENYDIYEYRIKDNINLIHDNIEINGSIDIEDSDTIKIIDNSQMKIIKPNTRK